MGNVLSQLAGFVYDSPGASANSGETLPTTDRLFRINFLPFFPGLKGKEQPYHGDHKSGTTEIHTQKCG